MRPKEKATVFQELDVVALTRDIESHGLKKGEIGTIVYVLSEGEAFTIEFSTDEGDTRALVDLLSEDIRPVEA